MGQPPTNNPASLIDPLGLDDVCYTGSGTPTACNGLPAGSIIAPGQTVTVPGDTVNVTATVLPNAAELNYVYGQQWASTILISYNNSVQSGGGNSGAANNIATNPFKPKPLSAWDKAGMVIACVFGMDPEYAKPMVRGGSEPSDSTDSTNTTEGQGPPMGPNKNGRPVPYSGDSEVPGGVAGGAAMGAGIAQCITNVFTAWPK